MMKLPPPPHPPPPHPPPPHPPPPKKTITIDGTIYDITNFNHPGGSIIGYAAGIEDAGDTFREFHARSKTARIVLNSLPKMDAVNAVAAVAAALWFALSRAAPVFCGRLF
jgi:hypothetical protein